MEEAMAITGGKGYGFVFETAGQVPTMHMAFELAGNKSHVCFIGTPHVNLEFTPAMWENMNLDGKSDSYINAAYDIAKQSFHERKSTNDQRERIAADKVRKDAKEVSNSTSARKKMIANMTGGRK